MRTVFDNGCGGGLAVADHLLGNDTYHSVREVAEGIEEVKHLARYMPQLYRIWELTKDLTDIIDILEGGILIRAIFSVTENNLVEGQTTFTVAGGFAAGTEQVFIERMALIYGVDYTLNTAGAIVLTNPARETDILVVRATQKKTVSDGAVPAHTHSVSDIIGLAQLLALPNRAEFSAAKNNLVANQTEFVLTGGYLPGSLLVFKNGAIVSTADYTAGNGSSVVFGSGVATDDIINLVGQRAGAATPSTATPFDPLALPTSLPEAPNVLWNNGGVLSIS